MWVGLLGCVALALFAGAETSRAPFVIFDEVVCSLSSTVDEVGCWDSAVR